MSNDNIEATDAEVDAIGEILYAAGWRDRADALGDGLRAAIPKLREALVKHGAAPVPAQAPDGYRLQPLSEYEAMLCAPIEADNAQLKAVWTWCRETAADFGTGNAKQQAKANTYLAVAHHIKSKYFRGCKDSDMLAAAQEGKP